MMHFPISNLKRRLGNDCRKIQIDGAEPNNLNLKIRDMTAATRSILKVISFLKRV